MDRESEPFGSRQSSPAAHYSSDASPNPSLGSVHLTMADGSELDFFDIFVFDRDEEAGGQQSELQEEHVPLIDLTVDSDDDGPSNSTPPVVQQDQPQSSSRQPRGAQPGQGQEPATDSEDGDDEESSKDKESSEDEDSSDDEASSSSNRRPVKTGARNRGSRGNSYPLEIITFSQLEQKDKDGAQRVLDLYRDERMNGSVLICSRFMSGKCRYMSTNSTNVLRHMKSRHPKEKHPVYQITQYPGFKDCKTNDFVTQSYPELKKTDPKLADEVLALYKRPQNKSKQKVHLCGHFVRGKCQYLSTNTSDVKSHMSSKHSRTLPMIKIVGYPGERKRTYHEYEQMTHAELKSKRSKVADQVLKYYYHYNCQRKVHLCGSCDFFSNATNAVRHHVARRHPPTTRVYKIIDYPSLALD